MSSLLSIVGGRWAFTATDASVGIPPTTFKRHEYQLFSQIIVVFDSISRQQTQLNDDCLHCCLSQNTQPKSQRVAARSNSNQPARDLNCPIIRIGPHSSQNTLLTKQIKPLEQKISINQSIKPFVAPSGAQAANKALWSGANLSNSLQV